MAGNTKILRQRIKSVGSTLQLTKAMGLVASSKIRRANENMYKAREYTSAVESAISVLSGDLEAQKSPYMKQRETNRTKIIVIAGDRGLAGGYNANIFRLCTLYKGSEFIAIGKRACERYSQKVVSSERYSFNDALLLAEKLCNEFKEEKFDRLGVIYTEYHSVMTVEPKIKWLLPFNKTETGEKSVLFEPNALTVLDDVAKEYVAGILIACIRESFACEVAARRMAMDSAGKNAKQMIDDLSLEYNRARQSAITQEITEIVAGSGN